MSQDTPSDQPQDLPHDMPAEDPNAPIPLEPREEPRRPAPPPGQAHIDAPGLTDGFDEDADFERDPEVERVVQGIPVDRPDAPRARPTAKVTDEEAPEAGANAMCPSGAWKVPAIIGAVAMLTAAVFSGIHAEHTHWAYVIRTIYWAALHTATGVGALVVGAILLERTPGSYEGIAARMLLVVSLFLVVFSLDIPIPTRIDETILAAAAYFGGLILLFRLSPKDGGVVAGLHFGIALLVTLGNMLSSVIGAGGLA